MSEDWSPLASGNPIPGDPGRVAELARRLGRGSAVMRRQCDRLRRVDPGCWEGRAADEFAKRQEKLPPLLDDVADRYDRVSNALDSYHPALEDAQSQAREALYRARGAEADMARAREGLLEMQQHEYAENARVAIRNENHPNRPPAQPAPWSGPNWGFALQEAEADMTAARALLEDAKALRDQAADRCAVGISDAIDDNLKNEGGISGWVKRGARWFVDTALPALADIASVVAAVLGVLSLVFPVLAPFALLAAVISLGLDLAMVATGQGSWMNVAVGVFGLVTFGLGRVVGAGARATQSGISLGKASRALKTAVSGKVTATTGTRVSGGAMQRTLKKQFGAIADHYTTAARGWKAVVPTPNEFRTAARALRNPSRLTESFTEQAALLTGRVDPVIAHLVPAVPKISFEASQIAIVGFQVDALGTLVGAAHAGNALLNTEVEKVGSGPADDCD